MIEALLYEKMDNKKVLCKACIHQCLIANKNRGICKVKENIDGVMYALNYRKTISFAVDPIEKKPLFHFYPKSQTYSFAAQGCNLICPWCQNHLISQEYKVLTIIDGTDITPVDHVLRAINNNCLSISYTYTEPTVFLEYALETMKIAKNFKILNVWVSNGMMTKETLDLIIPYLDAINIDLKGIDVYKNHTLGNHLQVLKNIKYLFESKIHIEIATLIIPSINDSLIEIDLMAKKIAEISLEIPWHISRFFPAWKMKNTKVTPIETLIKAKKIGEKYGIKYIYLGNI